MTRLERARAQMEAAGIKVAWEPCAPSAKCQRGRLDAEKVIAALLHDAQRLDAHWQLQTIKSPFHNLGAGRVEFRSYMGAFGSGSVHATIQPSTGLVEVDWDWGNPEESVWGQIAHGAQLAYDGLGGVWNRLKGRTA